MTDKERQAIAWARFMKNWDKILEDVQHYGTGDLISDRDYLLFVIGGQAAIQVMTDGDGADHERLTLYAKKVAQALISGIVPDWEFDHGSPVDRAWLENAGLN